MNVNWPIQRVCSVTPPDKWKLWPAGGARWKVKGLPTNIWTKLSGNPMNRFRDITAGTKWCADRWPESTIPWAKWLQRKSIQNLKSVGSSELIYVNCLINCGQTRCEHNTDILSFHNYIIIYNVLRLVYFKIYIYLALSCGNNRVWGWTATLFLWATVTHPPTSS